MRAEPSVDGRGGLLMRRIHNLTSFGPVFWAGAALPPADERYPLLHKYPLYTEMDKVAKADALEYLSSLVNETVQTGTTPEGKTMTFNERSLYSLPGDSSSLVLLLRQNSGSAGVPRAHCQPKSAGIRDALSRCTYDVCTRNTFKRIS